MLPERLVLVRHGQSEANLIQTTYESNPDLEAHPSVLDTADRQWRITELGTQQAQLAGHFIKGEHESFDRYIVSPFMRTLETAYHLGMPGAWWEENRSVRERSWGEIDSLNPADYARQYPNNHSLKEKDFLYWAPGAGESIAQVAENRVNNILNSMDRRDDKTVLIVTHGEFMWAMRAVIERWTDEEFLKKHDDYDRHHIYNASVIEYSRKNYCHYDQPLMDHLCVVRHSHPIIDETGTSWHTGEWMEFNPHSRLSNHEIKRKFEKFGKRAVHLAKDPL